MSTNSYLLRVGVAYYPFPVSQSIYLGRCAHLSGHIKVTHQPNFLDVEHLYKLLLPALLLQLVLYFTLVARLILVISYFEITLRFHVADSMSRLGNANPTFIYQNIFFFRLTFAINRQKRTNAISGRHTRDFLRNEPTNTLCRRLLINSPNLISQGHQFIFYWLYLPLNKLEGVH